MPLQVKVQDLRPRQQLRDLAANLTTIVAQIVWLHTCARIIAVRIGVCGNTRKWDY